jgi:hypothetical protein
MLYLIQVKNEKLDTLNFIEGVRNTSPHVLISEHGNRHRLGILTKLLRSYLNKAGAVTKAR